MENWRIDQQVAHEDFWQLYRTRFQNAGYISINIAKELIAFLGDQDAAVLYIGTFPNNPILVKSVLYEILRQMGRKHIPQEEIPVTCATLINLIGILPETRPLNFYDYASADLIVENIVIELLSRITDEAEREEAIRTILTNLTCYSSQTFLIFIIRGKGRIEENLVTEDFANDLTDKIFENFLQVPFDFLEQEWRLELVYWTGLRRGIPREKLPLPDSPIGLRILLESYQATQKSRGIGSYYVEQEDYLQWESLLELFGDQEAIKEANDILKEAGETELTRLIDKYLTGWRSQPEIREKRYKEEPTD